MSSSKNDLKVTYADANATYTVRCGGRRHVAILIHPDIPERFAASVRDRRERAEAIILVGQLGVTEIGRWRVDGRGLRELDSRLVEVGP